MMDINKITAIDERAVKQEGYYEVCRDADLVVSYKGKWGFRSSSFLISLVRNFKPHKAHGYSSRDWDLRCDTADEVVKHLANKETLLNLLQPMDNLRVKSESDRNERNRAERKAQDDKRVKDDHQRKWWRNSIKSLPTVTSVKELMGGIHEFKERVVTPDGVVVYSLIGRCRDDVDNALDLQKEMKRGFKAVGLIDGQVIVRRNKLPLKTRVLETAQEIKRAAPAGLVRNEYVPVTDKRGYTKVTITVPKDTFDYDHSEECVCLLKPGTYTLESEEHNSPEEQASINHAHWVLHKGKD